MERYTKSGRVVRIERDLMQSATVTIVESGVAESEGEYFECRSTGARASPSTDAGHSEAEELAERIVASIDASLVVERLLVTAGSADHRFENGARSAAWTDGAARVHLSIVSRRSSLRALIDLGDVEPARLDCASIAVVTDALARHVRSSRAVRHRFLRLAPGVSAALLAALAAMGPARREGPLVIRQATHEAMAHDGRGDAIENTILLGPGAHAAPNVFRPSYRIRPTRMAFHVEVVPWGRAVEFEPEAEAVALTAPVAIEGDEIRLEMLLEDGGAVVKSSSVEGWCEAIVQAGGDARWFPHGAGVWGVAMIVRMV